MNKLFKNSCWNIIYTLLNIVFPLIVSIVTSRVLMADGIGTVSYAQTIASYFSSLATLGIPIYGVKLISRAKNQDECDKSFSELFVLNFIINLIAIILYLSIIFIVPTFRNDIFLYLVTGLNVLFGLINVDWFYRGKEEFKFIAIRNSIVKTISLIFVIIFVKEKNDLLIYALISALALGTNHLFNIIHCRKMVKFSIKNISLKEHVKPIAILSIAGFFGLIYNKIDITMLGLLSSKEAIGLYNNAHQCILIAINVITSITSVFLPTLSKLALEKNKLEIKELLETGFKILFFIGMPAFIGLLLVSPKLIVTLFGTSFADAGMTLSIFSGLCLIVSIGDLLAYQTIMALGYEKQRIIINVIGCVINVCLNLILIPSQGQNGAAIATIISEFFINASLIIFISKKISFKFDLISIFKGILSSLIMGIAVYFILKIEMPLLLSVIVSVVSGLVTYVCIQIILKNDIFKLIKVKGGINNENSSIY